MTLQKVIGLMLPLHCRPWYVVIYILFQVREAEAVLAVDPGRGLESVTQPDGRVVITATDDGVPGGGHPRPRPAGLQGEYHVVVTATDGGVPGGGHPRPRPAGLQGEYHVVVTATDGGVPGGGHPRPRPAGLQGQTFSQRQLNGF